MNLKILNKTEVPLLDRTEIKAELSFSGATPSNKEVAENLASQLSTKVETIVIKSIYTEYGNQQAEVTAYVYNSKEFKDHVERKTKHIRDQEKKVVEAAKEAAEAKREEAKAAEEAKKAEAEAKAAEEAKPKEEAKEEPKAEEAKPKEEAKEEAKE